MSIRKSNKDHLRELAPQLVAVAVGPELIDDDPLTFYTRHEKKPCFVDLTKLGIGQSRSAAQGPNWGGAYSGRPELIAQLAPAIRDKLLFAAETTAVRFMRHMRAWWRLLDRLETSIENSHQRLERLTSVADLTDLHWRAAIDAGFDPHEFSSFRSVADTTRRALGLRPLNWRGPEKREPKRHLPPPQEIAILWTALKHRWFATLDRWSHAEKLLAPGATPPGAEGRLLQENYRHFEATRLHLLANQERNHPTYEELRNAYPRHKRPKGISPTAMYSGFYPDSEDVRAAFHLCLAGSGWNVQTLLDLTVEAAEAPELSTPFLRNHPTDPTRYILTGFKERGASEHDVHGDWKTSRSPGFVIKALVQRTWPMRQHILSELATAKKRLDEAQAAGASKNLVRNLWSEVQSLQAKASSVWLYFEKKGIQALSADNYRIAGPRPRKSFLTMLLQRSGTVLATSQIHKLTPSDFRDAFAAHIWRSTGGSILHVMRALGHRQAKTTTVYLNNTAVNQESAEIFRTFTNTLWDQVCASERLDPTVLAKVVRDGAMNMEERARLDEYRVLKRSRIGISCKDSFNPPATIDPTFVPDGKSQCTVQRCTLCLTHAIITPESLPGLCMRLAELRWLNFNMPVDSFVTGEYQVELENTEAALLGFDPSEVAARVREWSARIEEGAHRPIEFNGIQRETLV